MILQLRTISRRERLNSRQVSGVDRNLTTKLVRWVSLFTSRVRGPTRELILFDAVQKGPCIVSTREISDPSKLYLKGIKNEKVMQESPLT